MRTNNDHNRAMWQASRAGERHVLGCQTGSDVLDAVIEELGLEPRVVLDAVRLRRETAPARSDRSGFDVTVAEFIGAHRRARGANPHPFQLPDWQNKATHYAHSVLAQAGQLTQPTMTDAALASAAAAAYVLGRIEVGGMRDEAEAAALEDLCTAANVDSEALRGHFVHVHNRASDMATGTMLYADEGLPSFATIAQAWQTGPQAWSAVMEPLLEPAIQDFPHVLRRVPVLGDDGLYNTEVSDYERNMEAARWHSA